MINADELSEILANLYYSKLKYLTSADLEHTINQAHNLHFISDIQFAITIEGADLDAAYKCVKILTQKYPQFLEKTDNMGINTLTLLYTHNDFGKEVVLKLLLDDELNISKEIISLVNCRHRFDISRDSLAQLIIKDADFILPRIDSISIFERFNELEILPINIKDSNGQTILHHKFALSSLSAFATLLEKGAELLQDNNLQTPYDLARDDNKIEIVRYIEQRVRRNFVNSRMINQYLTSQEAFEIIAVHGFDSFIIASGSDTTNYLLKCSKHMYKMSDMFFNYLIEKGGNLRAQEEDGATLLHLATLFGNILFVKILIERAVDVNKKDRNGNTPLHYAPITSSPEIVRLLIKGGAFVFARNNFGRTPLHVASCYSSVSVVQLFLDNNADVNSTDWEYFSTPLCEAINRQNHDVIRLLIENGGFESIADQQASRLLKHVGLNLEVRYDERKKALIYNTPCTPKVLVCNFIIISIILCTALVGSLESKKSSNSL